MISVLVLCLAGWHLSYDKQ